MVLIASFNKVFAHLIHREIARMVIVF